MKLLVQRHTEDRGFDQLGTEHQTLFSHYQSVRTAVQYGARPWANDETVRCLAFYDDNLYRDKADEVFYLVFGITYHQKYVEKRILEYLPRENSMGWSARQIANALRLHVDIVEDTLGKLKIEQRVTYDATGYCLKGEKHRETTERE